MPFPKPFIEELKARCSLETIVGKYVELKRAGSNYVSCCPFHSERTPSFTVFPERNFYCFGCGAGGDVITFIMRIEGLDYRRAVEYLADLAGIPVPQEESGGYFVRQQQEKLTRERNYEMNRIAARYFYDNLMSQDGKAALDYFTGRGLSMSTIRHFGLGYAKDSFDDLTKTLLDRGFTVDELKEAFLCTINRYGKPTDMFRNRVMFPIIDTSGRIIAFGGRVLDDSKPKYLNSSDTPVFRKRNNLFALNFAKNACTGVGGSEKARAGELILCEGYMDVIALHQAGFTGAVATLGTAVTPEQARVIARYAKTLYVSYDSDDAGRRADEKAIKYMNEVGVDVKILKVTGGAKDPDEYIKKYGPESFRRLMTGASGQIDYRLSEIFQKYNPDIPEEKLAMLSDACALIAGVFPELRREVYILRLCEVTGAGKEAVTAEIRRRLRKNRTENRQNIAKSSEEALRRYGDKINPDAMKNLRCADTEEQILGMLMLFPEYFSALSPNVLCEQDFVTSFNRSVYQALKEAVEQTEDLSSFDLSSLNETFSPEQMGRIEGMYRRRRALSVNGVDTLLELCGVLRREREKASLPRAEEMSVEALDAYLKSRRKTPDDKAGA